MTSDSDTSAIGVGPGKPDSRRILRELTLVESDMIDTKRRWKDKPYEDEGTRISEPQKLTPYDREQRTRLRVECVEMTLRSQSSAMNSGVMTDETITRRAQSIFDWITA